VSDLHLFSHPQSSGSQTDLFNITWNKNWNMRKNINDMIQWILI